jgi:hypothetical protein
MAAFQLRPKLSEDEVHATPDFIEQAPKPGSRALPQITDADMDAARAKVGNWSSRNELKGSLPSQWSKAKTAKEETNELQTKNDDPSASAKAAGSEITKSTTASEPAPTHGSQVTNDQIATIEQVSQNPALARYFPRPAVGKPVYTVLPSFQVNDDSKIEVTVSSHEFETSMAKNDFSNSSTEGLL